MKLLFYVMSKFHLATFGLCGRGAHQRCVVLRVRLQPHRLLIRALRRSSKSVTRFAGLIGVTHLQIPLKIDYTTPLPISKYLPIPTHISRLAPSATHFRQRKYHDYHPRADSRVDIDSGMGHTTGSGSFWRGRNNRRKDSEATDDGTTSIVDPVEFQRRLSLLSTDRPDSERRSSEEGHNGSSDEITHAGGSDLSRSANLTQGTVTEKQSATADNSRGMGPTSPTATATDNIKRYLESRPTARENAWSAASSVASWFGGAAWSVASGIYSVASGVLGGVYSCFTAGSMGDQVLPRAPGYFSDTEQSKMPSQSQTSQQPITISPQASGGTSNPGSSILTTSPPSAHEKPLIKKQTKPFTFTAYKSEWSLNQRAWHRVHQLAALNKHYGLDMYSAAYDKDKAELYSRHFEDVLSQACSINDRATALLAKAHRNDGGGRLYRDDSRLEEATTALQGLIARHDETVSRCTTDTARDTYAMDAQRSIYSTMDAISRVEEQRAARDQETKGLIDKAREASSAGQRTSFWGRKKPTRSAHLQQRPIHA